MKSALSLARHCGLFLLICSSVASQPVTPEDFFERAQYHFERRRYLNALDSLRITLQMTDSLESPGPVHREAEVLAAESLAALQRHDEAVNMYERAISHGYDNPGIYAYLGKRYDDRGKWREAKKYFEKYFDINKTDAATHIRYAIVLGRQGDREKAKQVLEAIEPTSGGRPMSECEALEKKKKISAALDCFGGVKTSRPDREASYLALYRISSELRQPALAAEHAMALYALFGAETRYIWPLVEVRLAERRFYDARLLLEEIIRSAGPNPDAERLLTNLQRQAPQAFEKPYRASPKEMQMLDGQGLR